MCLFVKKGFRKAIAKKDIYVLKVATHVTEHRCQSFYQKTAQYYTIPLKSVLNVRTNTYRYAESYRTVEEGLHSIVDVNECLRIRRRILYCVDQIGIILGKIPVGSTYYLGKNGDIVSDQLILVEPLVVDHHTGFKDMVDVEKPIKSIGDALDLAVEICESYDIKIGL